MNNSDREKGFLAELKEFLAFLQSLWGILGGVSLFFPLSNALAQVIPLGQDDSNDFVKGAFRFFSPSLVTATTTLVAIFVVFSTFSERHQLSQGGSRVPFQRKSGRTFAVGLDGLVAYLIGSFLVTGVHIYGQHDQMFPSYETRELFGDTLLLLFYCAFFTLTTRAFELLALVEYSTKKA